ncbi:MAG: type III pantothenate kinase [Candidatus Marinimicrobia bacterium]|jgi:type III pantothenate kinase|nr:type III pantothenate kinase [Candidatus Neomarinimicrobiota bacterium]MBT3945414.1 type III pantothenate kinase [Candidatus Neomarinimicrobiota bacterium]MBT4155062.1 type III pantothenate kinase [Candidatus Neomarinimicrobiota bacterium]MBT4753548.1 type III pantothenate kinase [Candidatus Neomarinimicrobiota bacterium]MBT5114465.1 type III pantothenate kinase [Candidatus Neomarinimicrobiota bacterium]
MILCLDVGNTSIHGGVFNEKRLILQFRKTSSFRGSSDEIGIFLRSVLNENDLDPKQISHIGICSVVPDAIHSLRNACIKYFGIRPFELGPGAKIGLKINYRNPAEVGADRIAAAVAAVDQFPGKNLILIDFGTATTFDVVTKDKVYQGGTIIPGLQISMEALEQKAAKLPPVEIVKREKVVGRSTMGSIQSGLYFGQMGMVKELIKEITRESFPEEKPVVVATGGFSNLYRNDNLFHIIVPELVLLGIHIAVNKNMES